MILIIPILLLLLTVKFWKREKSQMTSQIKGERILSDSIMYLLLVKSNRQTAPKIHLMIYLYNVPQGHPEIPPDPEPR